MNISFNDTLSAPKRRARSTVMILVACALSALNIFIEKIYASTPKFISSYDPFSLYFITLITSTVLLSSALTMLSYENKNSIWMISLASACAVALSCFALGASPSDILLTLAFIPSAIIISICISSECEKAHSVVANAVVIGLALLLSLVLSHYSVFGEISKDSIIYALDLLRDSFLAIYDEFGYSGLGISNSYLHAVFEIALLLIPSLFCAFTAVLSYIQVSIARAVILGQGVNSEKLVHWPLKMSRLASFAFLASFLIAALSTSSENQLLIISATNMMIVLLPGFFLIGVRSSFMHVRRPGFLGMIFGVFILISCIQNPAMIFVLIATLGAIDNLFTSFRARLYGETKK